MKVARRFVLMGLLSTLVGGAVIRADREVWGFSVYSYPLKKFIHVGPFTTKAACDDERDGYLRNDSYRNASDCITELVKDR